MGITQIWQIIQFCIDNWGGICAVGWAISEALGMFGKGGVIPVAFQAIFKKGAQKEISDAQIAKLEQDASLKNK